MEISGRKGEQILISICVFSNTPARRFNCVPEPRACVTMSLKILFIFNKTSGTNESSLTFTSGRKTRDHEIELAVDLNMRS